MDSVRNFVAERDLLGKIDPDEHLAAVLNPLLHLPFDAESVGPTLGDESRDFWDERKFAPLGEWKQVCGFNVKLELSEATLAWIKRQVKRVGPNKRGQTSELAVEDAVRDLLGSSEFARMAFLARCCFRAELLKHSLGLAGLAGCSSPVSPSYTARGAVPR